MAIGRAAARAQLYCFDTRTFCALQSLPTQLEGTLDGRTESERSRRADSEPRPHESIRSGRTGRHDRRARDLAPARRAAARLRADPRLGHQLQRAEGGFLRGDAGRVPVRPLPDHAGLRRGAAVAALRDRLAAPAARRVVGTAAAGVARPPDARGARDLRHRLVDGVLEFADPRLRPRVHAAAAALARRRAPDTRADRRRGRRLRRRADLPLGQAARRAVARERRRSRAAGRGVLLFRATRWPQSP